MGLHSERGDDLKPGMDVEELSMEHGAPVEAVLVVPGGGLVAGSVVGAKRSFLCGHPVQLLKAYSGRVVMTHDCYYCLEIR